MKKLLIFLFVHCFAAMLHAQEVTPYAQLLNNSPEITLKDSLPVSSLVRRDMKELDSSTLLHYFKPVLANGNQAVKLKNRDFYTGGRITTQDHFDLLVLVEDKKKEDSTVLRVIYLVTTKKDGTYISSFKAGVTGTKKKSSYQTSSWITKNLDIRQDSKITTTTSTMADVVRYRITNTGRFMMQLD